MPDTLQAESILDVRENEEIANPTRLAATDGGFALYDAGTGMVNIYSEEAELTASFGGRGRGPGEFQSVSALAYRNGLVLVSDSDLLRLTSFGQNGNVERTVDLEAALYAIDTGILSSQSFLVPTNGQQESLALYVDRENGSEFRFGEPVVEAPGVADFNSWQKDLSSGTVPDFFRNRVAVSGRDSLLYLFLQTEGVLRQYDSGGNLTWERRFSERPEFRDEFDRFVEQNRDNEPGEMYMLQYAYEMQQTDRGVYLFLRIPPAYPPTLLFVDHSNSGSRLIRIEGMDPRPSHFSIAPSGNRVYFLNIGEGVVYRTDLPVQG
ncbi:MAG: hypothetical protein U5K31_10490 [Balneolaceae bacterium]|nr:hypothetical protein [Balneolaceae bacterium]